VVFLEIPLKIRRKRQPLSTRVLSQLISIHTEPPKRLPAPGIHSADSTCCKEKPVSVTARAFQQLKHTQTAGPLSQDPVVAVVHFHLPR
jgi:hypothetical protein